MIRSPERVRKSEHSENNEGAYMKGISMDYILLVLESRDSVTLPPLFLVSEAAVSQIHESGGSIFIDLYPVLLDVVPGGMNVILDRVFWLDPEVGYILRDAYKAYAVLWKGETTIPFEFAFVKRTFTFAGYL